MRARRERPRRRPRLLLPRRVRGHARSRDARVLRRLQRRASATRCGSAISRPAPTFPTSSRTSPTDSRGPTTRARASTSVPTTRCARNEVWRHVLGTPATDDVLVLREDDERFYLGIERTRSGRFVLIDISSKLTSEVWFVPTETPDSAPQVIAPREHGHEYTVEHHWNLTHGRPVLHRHEPGRRGAQLRARRGAVRRPRARRTGRPSFRTATTSSSTPPARSPITSC